MTLTPTTPPSSAGTDAHALRIDGEFTIYRAAELKPLLLGAVRTAPTLELDLSEVAEFDTAGLQLLLLARREAAALGHALRLVNPSEPVTDVLQMLGLSPRFDLHVHAAAA